MSRAVSPSRVANRLWSARCTAAVGVSGDFCDAASAPDMPFPLCARHAIQVWRAMQQILDQAVVDDPDALLAAALGMPLGSAVPPEVSRQRALSTRSRFVYYVQIGDHIKIGVTNNIDKRMRDYPPASRLLAVESGGIALERSRHQQFSHLLDARREYFRPSEDLADFVAGVVREHGDPALIRARHLSSRKARDAANRLGT